MKFKATGTCLAASSFSTSNGPGLQLEVLLDKMSEADPDVKITLVAYSKLVRLLKDVKVNDRISADTVVRNNNQKGSVYFLATFIHRPNLN